MTHPSNLFVIIDGNAIIHRAYHALPPMTTKDGAVVNAVYGFTSMLLKVWRELKPQYFAVTFDMAGGTFRDKISDQYKATRVKADQALYDQIPLVHEVVRAFNLPIFEKQGYEADDVIGTIVTQTRAAKSAEIPEMYVVTGDMDTLQLIQDGVRVYTLRKGMTDVVIYDAPGVHERYGFGPEHVIDYKALRGDTSDNIPGVPGIGEKTAVELIQKFGSVDDLYKKLEKGSIAAGELKPSVFKKLEEGKDSAFMSKQLATIKTDVPDLEFSLEACRVKPFDRDTILALFQKFEFVSLLKRLPEFGKIDVPQSEEKSVVKEKKIGRAAKAKANFVFKELKTVAEVADMKRDVRAVKQFAARIVTSGDNFFAAKLAQLVVVVEGTAYAIPPDFWNDAAELFTDATLELVGHDLKHLVKQARLLGVRVANQLSDAMVAAYLLNPGSRSHDIASIVLKLFGKELVAPEGQGSLFGIDARVVAEELWYVLKAMETYGKELAAIDDYGLFKKMEMPLIDVLADMELAGISVDTGMLKKISTEVAAEIKNVSQTIYDLTGNEFNIASPIQLREVLFDKLAIPVEGVKKGKTGLSTSAESLEKLRDLHPVIPYIEQFRELTKIQNTYVDVLPALVNPVTGRIHTTFNQTIAATGRLSSIDPNLQNIPVRTALGREIRKAFVPGKGLTFVSADYSQIELRVVASLAQDEKMMAIFKAGEDIHAATAAAIHGVALKDVTKEMRYAAKEINFGVLYGMGTYGLSWRAGISFAEAKEFIDKYFQQFKGVRAYIDRTLEFTKKEGYCETLFGRRRYIPELAAGNFQVRAAAERMAVNHPIQGTAADIMKLAMIAVHERLAKLGSKTAKLLLQVHDELVAECLPDEAETIGQLLKDTMESVVDLRVPVKAAVKTGASWGVME